MKHPTKIPGSAPTSPHDEELRAENRQRGRGAREFELIDTGIFADDAYFDIIVEYAKAAPDDILVRITAHNRAKAVAPIHILPVLWFRNDWSWRDGVSRPSIAKTEAEASAIVADSDPSLGEYWLSSDGDAKYVVFTENETDYEHTYGVESPRPFVKDGFHRHVVNGDASAVSENGGTKAAFYYIADVEPGSSFAVRLASGRCRMAPRSTLGSSTTLSPCGLPKRTGFTRTCFRRRPTRRTATFSDAPSPGFSGTNSTTTSMCAIGSRAIRSCLRPPADQSSPGRNKHWQHLHNEEIMSMPDDWEYPWYAAWDLGFHVITLAMIDPGFAKRQLEMLTHEISMHPVGQLPA